MKTVLFAAILLVSLSQAKAQNVHFGIKGGMNASSLAYPGNGDMQTKIGFHAGLLAHIHTASRIWALQPEVYYSSEGAKSKSNSNVQTQLGYIQVPVLAQYQFDNGFRLEAGPQLGFLINAKNKVAGSSTDIKDNMQGVVFSIPLGIGYLTMTGLGFDARYNFGITNIRKNTEGTKVQSNVFQFGIFYQFSGNKISH